MDQELLAIIATDFKKSDQAEVIRALTSITLAHVMAASAYNLRNTRMAVLYLAQGNLEEVISFTESAKFDFRDVILWAIEEKNKGTKDKKIRLGRPCGEYSE